MTWHMLAYEIQKMQNKAYKNKMIIFSIIFSEIKLPTRIRKKISDMEVWGLSNSTCFIWSPSDSKRILGVTTANKIEENNKQLCQ